jgi:hypothetical protein
MAGDDDDPVDPPPLSEASRTYLKDFLQQVRSRPLPDSPRLIEQLERFLASPPAQGSAEPGDDSKKGSGPAAAPAKPKRGEERPAA